VRCTVPQQDRIVGERFESLCDIKYTPGILLPSVGVCVVFCKTDYVLSLLEECRIKKDAKFILITNHSDYPVGHDLIQKTPLNVVKWYAINVTHRHPILESIPLGSASSTWIGEYNFAEAKDSSQFILIEEDGIEKQFENLVYMDFGIHTNPTHRKEVYNYFKDKEWVTKKPCDIPLHEYKHSSLFNKMEKYYLNTYNHKYVVSPLGNGVDCGRVWQAIYLGTIPIIPRHTNIGFYLDLPILVYDDLSQITKEFLEEQYDKIIQNSNLEKSTMSYWKEQIKKEKQKHKK